MRKITKDSVNAFMNAQKFSQSNMQVEVLPNVTILKYHGNSIAFRYNDPKGTIAITNCGWGSPTTKERLNGVLYKAGKSYSIKQKDWVWYMDGKEWDGSLIDIN
jgi:hypothetical protein|tara:strand:+ start:1390 stop:1701 length:312 start_codon:yes stop_codon:yes gene_type:complete